MPVTRISQVVFGGIAQNEDANDFTSQIALMGVAENASTVNDFTSQINMGGIAENENSNAFVSQIVFLAITSPGTGVFRELFTPLTST